MTLRPWLLTALMFSMVSGSLWATDAPKERTVSVQGTAKVSAEPDIARVWVEVTEEGSKAEDVILRVRKKMEAVVSAVKAQGIADKDLQTKQYRVAPKTRWDNGRSIRDGYTASNQLEVRIRDLSKTGTLISAATNAGANNVNGPQFEIENPKVFQQKALRLAMEDAKTRATLLAEAGGAALGPVQQINESSSFVPGPRPMLMRAMGVARETAAAPESIESGQEEITATVSATFALR